jgi:hypothetical protein
VWLWVPTAPPEGKDSPAHACRPKLWALRGVLGFASVAFIQEAVKLLPLSDALALAMLSPLAVAAAGTLLLRERAPQLLLVALPLATGGALMLAKPALFRFFTAGQRGGVGVGAADVADELAGHARLAVAGLGPAGLGIAAGLAHVLCSAGAKLSVRHLAAGSSSAGAAGAIVLSAGLVSAAGSAGACALQRSRLVWPRHAGSWALLAAMGLLVGLCCWRCTVVGRLFCLGNTLYAMAQTA